MNNKIWITNQLKTLRKMRKVDELNRLRNVIIAIKSEKENKLKYMNRRGNNGKF